MRRQLFILGAVLQLVMSCSQPLPNSVAKELDKMSTKNQKKFMKVFRHFRNSEDSLKLKAAYFLVENINDFGFYYGSQLENYNTIFDILAAKPADYRENLAWYSNEVGFIFDSLEQRYGRLDVSKLKSAKDADVITSDYLVDYINQTFEAWNNPWSRNISFDNFCEYILPYRNFNEPVENWRPAFMKEFDWISDSINANMSLVEVARLLNRDTELKYSRGFDRYITSIPPGRLLQARYGNCSDNANYKAMIMRSYGIPVSVDYMPQYGTDHNVHYWNAIMVENDRFISFGDTLNDINAQVAYKYTLAKVYRRFFSKNTELITLNEREGNNVPPAFRNVRLRDVTEEYVPVSEVSIDLTPLSDKANYAYLAVFNNAGWTPIAYTRINSQGKTLFENLGRAVVYLPLIVQNGQYIPITVPFKIEKDGEIVSLDASGEPHTVKLTRKYHFHQRKENWLKCLLNGHFEVANQADFSDAKVIGSVNKTPSEHTNHLRVSTGEKYRYFRFVFSPDELKLPYDGDGASLAELTPFDSKGNPIKGIPISSEGRKYNPYISNLCFDGNPLTFFEDARYGATGKFIGLNLGEPHEISEIVYIPRNDLNSIQPGDQYELYFWDNNHFSSLGRKTATDTVLVYDNVPEKALLWLRNLSGGREERIFTWEDGKQQWW